MGIFQTFLDSSPLAGTLTSDARREIDQLIKQGDADVPVGFAGRNGWAMLKVLGATHINVPPTLGMPPRPRPDAAPHSGASNALLEAIAEQIALDENDPDMGEDVLLHLGVCRVTPFRDCIGRTHTPVMPLGRVDDFDIKYFTDTFVPDGTDISSWPSAVGSRIFLKHFPDLAPLPIIFNTTPFNGKGGLKFEQVGGGGSNISAMRSNSSSIIEFPNNSGTIAMVFDVQIAISPSTLLSPISGTLYRNFRIMKLATDTAKYRPVATDWGFGSAVAPGVSPTGIAALELPEADIPLNTTQIWIWQVNNNRMEFRRNGVQKRGFTLNDPTPQTLAFPMWIMGVNAKTDSINGRVARFLRWERVLSLDELLDVEEILTSLYI